MPATLKNEGWGTGKSTGKSRFLARRWGTRPPTTRPRAGSEWRILDYVQHSFKPQPAAETPQVSAAPSCCRGL